MEQLEPDLWQTSRRTIADGVCTRAYLLTKPSGNLLIYNLGEDQEEDLEAIEGLGGVAVQVLSHRDEASPAVHRVRERFASRLAYHEADAHAIRDQAEADLSVAPGCDDPTLAEVEVLHTPGHTPGSVTLRYESPHGKTYLFTGDTIVPVSGGWVTAVYDELESDAAALVESLERLREVDADLIVSSAFVGETSVVEMTSEEWPGIVDGRIASLERRFSLQTG